MTLEDIRCPKCGGANYHIDDEGEREYYDHDGPTSVYCNTNICDLCGTRYHVIEVEVPTVVERCVYEEDATDEEMMRDLCGYELDPL